MAACGNPRIVMGVTSKILPSVQGVHQEFHEADCAELRKIHALTKTHFTHTAEIGFGGPATLRFGHSGATGLGGPGAPAGWGGGSASRPCRRPSAHGTETFSRRCTPPHTPHDHGGCPRLAQGRPRATTDRS